MCFACKVQLDAFMVFQDLTILSSPHSSGAKDSYNRSAFCEQYQTMKPTTYADSSTISDDINIITSQHPPLRSKKIMTNQQL